MRHTKLLFVTLFSVFFFQAFGQRPNRDYNKIGVSGGVLFSNIDSDNLPISASTGFTVGFETRGSVTKHLDFIYGLSFYQANVDLEVQGPAPFPTSQPAPDSPIQMTLSSVQLQFLASLNLIRHHLSIELGPAVAIQGKFKPSNTIDDDIAVAGFGFFGPNDLREVNTVDFRLAGGITAGFEPVRVSLLYLRGMTNMFSNIEVANQNRLNLEGKTDYLALRAQVYF